MRSTWFDRKRRQRGTQLVEFAVGLPLLLFICFASIEGASFVRAHQVINNAAREGARIASNYEAAGYFNAAGENVLAELATCNYLNDHKSAFPGWGGDANCGEPFTVKVEKVPEGDPEAIMLEGVHVPSARAIVTYNYQFKYMPFLAYFRPDADSVTLRAWANFRLLYL